MATWATSITVHRQAGLAPRGRDGKGLVGKWHRCGFHTNSLRLLETKFASQGTQKARSAPCFHLLHPGSWVGGGHRQSSSSSKGSHTPVNSLSSLSLPSTPITLGSQQGPPRQSTEASEASGYSVTVNSYGACCGPGLCQTFNVDKSVLSSNSIC